MTTAHDLGTCGGAAECSICAQAEEQPHECVRCGAEEPPFLVTRGGMLCADCSCELTEESAT